MKNVTEARQALEEKLFELRELGKRPLWKQSGWMALMLSIMAAAEVLGDARELRGHVKACRERKQTIFNTVDLPGRWTKSKACGQDDWYCDDARRLIDGD